MRTFIFLALLAPILAFEVNFKHEGALNELQKRQARIMENEIKAFLECIRNYLKNGDPETNFPVMDPLNINREIDLDALNIPEITGKVLLKDITLNGIASWDLTNLKITITIIPIGAKVVADVNWAGGDVKGAYSGKINVFGHELSGDGNIDGALSKLRINVKKAQAVLNPIRINSLDVEPTLESARLVIENLVLDGQDISEPLSNFANELPTWLTENTDLIEQKAIEIINAILEQIQASGYEGNIISKCLAN